MGGEPQTVDGLPARPPQNLEAALQRARQLEQALTSRIIIEQAKGILKERFGLTIDQAFHLLRSTARSNRQSIHQLAQQIVDRPDTPGAIIQTLARPPSHHQAGVDKVGLHAQQNRLARIQHESRSERRRR